MLFERVAIIGVGLIGGSFALALKQAKACAHVVGAGRTPANLKLALERGVIDSMARDAAEAARGADLVLLATPLAQFPAVFTSIGKALGPKAIVTDAGSTKRDVIAAAKKALAKKISQFVPAHPIAGSERSGVGVANQAWALCGARVSQMDAQEHDALLAAVSHLPHLLAFALVHEVAGRENSAQLFSFAASGFRDFTRIASSHPEMWRDICIANRDRLTAEVSRFSKKLDAMRKLLEKGDGAALEKLFAEAREARNRWLRSS